MVAYQKFVAIRGKQIVNQTYMTMKAKDYMNGKNYVHFIYTVR